MNIQTADGEYAHIGPEFKQFSKLPVDPEAFAGFCEKIKQAVSAQDFEEEQEKQYLSDQWESEKNTWLLLDTLLTHRFGPPEQTTVNQLSSDYHIIRHIFNNDFLLKEHLLVKQWLEQTAPPFNPVETRKGYWLYTLKEIRSKTRHTTQTSSNLLSTTQSHKIVSQIDPDAPCRQGKCLDSDDTQFEQHLNKTLFEYIRRGQLASAIDLCRSCDQPWKAAAFRGLVYATDEFIQGNVEEDDINFMGNLNRELWKLVCFEMAKDGAGDAYERAYNAVFAGDVDNAIGVCNTWEDHVWLMYNALIEFQLDRKLSEYPTLAYRDGFNDKTPSSPILLTDRPNQTNIKTPDEMFEGLCKSDNNQLMHRANDPFHIIQTFIILDRIPDLMLSLRTQIEKARIGEATPIPNIPQILRFMVHFIILIRLPYYQDSEEVYAEQSEEMRDDQNYLIKIYIELLITSGNHTLVAMYAKLLPRDEQVEVYSIFLKDVNEGKSARLELCRLANANGMDSEEICKVTVQLILTEHILNEPLLLNTCTLNIHNLTAPVSSVDEKCIRALEYVTFEKKQYRTALEFANLLFRRFFALGRIQSTKSLFQILPKSLIPARQYQRFMTDEDVSTAQNMVVEEEEMEEEGEPYDDNVDEYLKYKSLMGCLEYYFKWCEMYGGKPLSTGDDMGSLKYKEWANGMKSITKALEKDITDLIQTKWLIPESEALEPYNIHEKSRRSEMKLLREIYIPELIFWLHSILYETRDIIPGNLEKSINLVDIVSNDEYQIYFELHKSKKIDKFFALVRKSALLCLEQKNLKTSQGMLKKHLPWESVERF